MAEKCGTTFPQHFNEQFAKINNENDENKLSIEISTKICDKLIEEGVQNFHFYTLNKPTLTSQIISALGFTKFSLNSGVKIAR
jgi:methylenetetrahydrofolate reductase (NADPH)